MPEDKLKFLGDRIRSARKDCGLTQQALADQADLAVKTIQDLSLIHISSEWPEKTETPS